MVKRTNKALLLVDIQNDFLPGGSLAVPRGDEIIPLANHLQKYFDVVIASQDWHPQNHFSFKALWPAHCIQNSKGAELSEHLEKKNITKIIHKGTHPDIDSYSTFFDNAHQQKTDLDAYLKSHFIHDIYIMGLATDYCVKFSVVDALALGYNVYVIEDGCRGIHQPESALDEMKKAGAKIIPSSHVLKDK